MSVPSDCDVIVLKRRPDDALRPGDLAMERRRVRAPGPGEPVVRNLVTTVDPYQLRTLRGSAEIVPVAIGDSVPANSVGIEVPATRAHRLEAVGVPEAWQEAVELVRKGGTVNFFGGCAKNTHVTLDTNRIHYSDITLRATFHHTPAICRKALALIASGRFQASAFITGHAHLYELNRVFEKLMNRSTESEIKTAIVP